MPLLPAQGSKKGKQAQLKPQAEGQTGAKPKQAVQAKAGGPSVPSQAPAQQAAFIPSKRFTGPRAGCVTALGSTMARRNSVKSFEMLMPGPSPTGCIYSQQAVHWAKSRVRDCIRLSCGCAHDYGARPKPSMQHMKTGVHTRPANADHGHLAWSHLFHFHL